ncbi:hypothetical protein KC333_g3488 [Hortaea werneckii]|uniref:54S ribosomal protein L31, mitochondrial n=1 Tax=Hortaea werneckii TaxID=91943 RepID=A0A3M6X3L5_HORWE|nr:hypothetical protein KC324_g6671 [Hortaea werneckii]KAI7218620.1 hypothetical protein KC333_g3488 [Hortaea werneckii]KAI7237990.1 hypothetical protein KC330_g2857 [Hortaea werneckii]KAI7321420.1 hypothetical protein KC326_g2219 [Hortaea werneckii]KAI7587515.1 hypothetical protein KC316_g5011 [Hortaea werneckii]
MFGAFKPSAPLSGGLLWKIPWRMSPPQKLRHRRRLRRVDNVVSVLDNALQRQIPSAPTSAAKAKPSLAPTQSPSHNKAAPEELSATAEGQRLLAREQHKGQEERRHGRGPRQGEVLATDPEAEGEAAVTGGQGRVMLGDQARTMGTMKAIERWKVEMPREEEMLSRDKYTMFDRKAKGYRKGVHKLPKWTRLSQRLNPPGF